MYDLNYGTVSATYGIPHRTPDKLFQTLSEFTVDDLEHGLVARSTFLACLPDDGGGNVNRDLPDVREIGQQGRVGVVQGRGEVGEGLDTGHEHAGRDLLASREDCSETETGVDLKGRSPKVLAQGRSAHAHRRNSPRHCCFGRECLL